MPIWSLGLLHLGNKTKIATKFAGKFLCPRGAWGENQGNIISVIYNLLGLN